MPTFFFALRDHIVETDDVGVDLPDRAAARIEAIRFAGEVLRDQPYLLDQSRTLRVEVTEAGGAEAFRLEIRAVHPAD